MARKLTSSEELAFSQHRPFTELLFGSEQYYAQYFRQKVTRVLPELQPTTPLLEDSLPDGDGGCDDWF